MKVLITGAGGHLGRAIARALSDRHDVVALKRAELDITDARTVRARISTDPPQVVINCAAYNNVDEAEERQATALAVNAFAVLTLARAAADVGAIFVHYSTDFVFDGTASRAYTEADEPNPQSVYAVSKMLGEWFAGDAPRHYILRVESLFGGEPHASRGSLECIAEAIRQGQPARVFVDRTVSPSHVVDVANATLVLLDEGAAFGLYHCVNSGMTSWHDLALEIARLLGRDAHLEPITIASLSLKARRPVFSALSNAKLASVGITMPSWQDALARYLRAGEG